MSKRQAFSDAERDLFRANGGRLLAMASPRKPEVWDFGYRHESRRTEEEDARVHSAIKEMVKFAIHGKPRDDKKSALFELWKHPTVVESNGWEFPGIHQFTGSCVGAGGGTMWATLAFIEAIRLGDPELPVVPFWLLPYGRSRYYLGDRSPGEGSTGGTFAKAAREDGVVPATRSGLPPFRNNDMLEWGASVERSWSDGDAQQTMDLLSTSRMHLVKTTAQCRDHNDVRQALQNGFPCTAASMYAHDGGSLQGDPQVSLGKRRGSWSHQMSILAWWEHPTLGEIFFLMNQWGRAAHKASPCGAPPGGVWITKGDVDYICKDEVFAFSQFAGFPAPDFPIPWGTL